MGLGSKTDARNEALLLAIAGPQAIEMFNTFVLDKLDAVLGKFNGHATTA